MYRTIQIAAVVVALTIGGILAFGVIRLGDAQEDANCVSAAEALYPVEVLPKADPEEPPGLANFGERQEAVDACNVP